MTTPRFVIVGGGQAAAAAAEELRNREFAGEVVILAEEHEYPYERPPLSKEYLLSGDATDLYFKPAQWYADNKVTVVQGAKVVSVDPKSRALSLEDGSEERYDKLLIATGGRPRIVPSITGARVRYLRDKVDADRMNSELVPGATLVVIGAGFVGCEVAASVRKRGVDVIVLEALDVPMKRALGDDVGHAMAEIHRTNGVDLRLSTTITAITESGEKVVLSTSDGEISADYVLVAIGMTPNTELLDGSGIEVGNGVLVDEFCRSSDPDVYAAGDVANAWDPELGRRVRVEHYDNAAKQGAAAAANMLGAEQPHSDSHWFWSDQYEHNLQAVGLATDYDQVVIRRESEGPAFAAFYVKGKQVQAAFALDNSKEILRVRKLIAAGTEVTPEQLADPSVDLRKVGRPERGPRPT
ncbi:MAG TPA: FAD-dependent oxidoreductase [Sporichthyaceae bacterium]|nr:FAD-dependent oxidoreductase [Sporichthyaceae bacterium]